MKLLLILLVAMVACAAPDPTMPEDRLQEMKDYLDQAIAEFRTEPDRTQEDIDQAIAEARTEPDRTQEDVIDLSPSATVSSIHADVGDRVVVQVDISGYSQCTDLTVRDPFGNAIELAPKKIRDGDVEFVQYRGAFFAAAAGEYLVDLEIDSENLRCGGVAPRRAEVKWTVQPN